MSHQRDWDTVPNQREIEAIIRSMSSMKYEKLDLSGKVNILKNGSNVVTLSSDPISASAEILFSPTTDLNTYMMFLQAYLVVDDVVGSTSAHVTLPLLPIVLLSESRPWPNLELSGATTTYSGQFGGIVQTGIYSNDDFIFYGPNGTPLNLVLEQSDFCEFIFQTMIHEG